ncbi:MAG: InlB B-repeat-containing protein [Blautia sp.]
MTGMRRFLKWTAAFLLLVLLGSAWSLDTWGAIKESDVFLDANWKYAGETSVFQATGWLQAVCSTDDYIICLENYDNNKTNPDTLIAFYKNPYDEDGNPVQQYSYAKHITEMDYEHGNGMTYDTVRNEIVIAGGRAINKANTGCIFIVDGDTLKFKRKVKATDEGRVAAIDYWKDKDQYVLMIGNKKNEFKFVITDADFNPIDTIEDVDISAGNAFQDFCISGDYIISIPFMKRTGKDDVLQVYSISEKRLMGTYSLQMEDEDTYVEPESICEIEPGKLLIGSALKDPSRIAFYTTRVDSAFSVTTNVEHGTVTSSQKVVDQGTDFTVKYTPDENYELSSVIVDGAYLDINEYPNEYVFPNLQENHEIIIDFTEIPVYPVETLVQNGTIDGEVQVRRDKNVTIHYEPDAHYELSKLLVDGQEVDTQDHETEYTLENVQGPVTFEAVFEEVPSFSVTTEVENGQITPTVEKIYRDESCTIQYEADEDYEAAHILVDGEELEDVTVGELREYTFEDIQGPHKIKVVYQWKYLPLVILGIFWLAAWLIAIQALKLERRRRSRRGRKKEESKK